MTSVVAGPPLSCLGVRIGPRTPPPYGMRMPRPLTRAEVVALADALERLTGEMASGALAAPAGTAYRLEGALVALRVTLGEQALPDAWTTARVDPTDEAK